MCISHHACQHFRKAAAAFFQPATVIRARTWNLVQNLRMRPCMNVLRVAMGKKSQKKKTTTDKAVTVGHTLTVIFQRLKQLYVACPVDRARARTTAGPSTHFAPKNCNFEDSLKRASKRRYFLHSTLQSGRPPALQSGGSCK